MSGYACETACINSQTSDSKNSFATISALSASRTSPLILQPGPAALTDGQDAIVKALWPASPVS
jgi:hypothetical protein